jgi:preprotein translocase SecF subunit
VEADVRGALKMKEGQDFASKAFIGSVVAGRMKVRAFLAIVAALACIVLYIWMRFELRFGVAAIIALAHDVILTLGALAIFDYFGVVDGKISLPIVAAILTIIGYSLNDTIVVFDRIRENVAKRRKDNYLTVVNDSINQTLSRTLLTSLTTLIAAVVLFFVGARQGGVLEGFAFALIVGVLVGTYSSIFIASPVLVAWHLFSEKKRG